jgi:hypothetical protein
VANPSIGLVGAGTMVGGDSEAIDRCAAVFEVIGGNVAHLGPPGAGQLGKAINQMAMGVAEASFLEAMLVGLKGGLAPQQVWKVLSTAGATKTSFERAAKAVNEGNAEHHDCKIGGSPLLHGGGRRTGLFTSSDGSLQCILRKRREIDQGPAAHTDCKLLEETDVTRSVIDLLRRGLLPK